jgi:hypothetical protein
MFLAPASAMAVISGHTFDFEFAKEEGTVGGKFGFSYAGSDIAVNNMTGDIYVTDPGNARVQKFDDEGNFLMTWGYGVKDGSNEFQVCEAPEPCQAGLPGFAPGQFVLPAGIAIDNSNGPNKGRVYVIEVSGWYGQGRNAVLAYSEDGEPEGSFNGENSPLGVFTEPAAQKLDVDGEGTVWVADREWPQGSRVMRFSNQPSNAYIGGSEWEMKYEAGGQGLQPGPAFNMAATPSGDAVYISTWYQGNCCGLYRVVANGSSQRLAMPTSGGVTVFDKSNGHFFVGGMEGFTRGNSLAQEFDGDPVDPQPVGPPTFWPEACCGVGGMAFNPDTSTLYANGPYGGPIGVFKPRRVPETITEPATEVLHTTATIHAHTAPDPVEGGPVSECVFEWGLTTNYEHTDPCQPGAPITEPTDVSLPLSGLSQEGTYHYRVSAANSVDTEYGKDRQFTVHAVLSLETMSATDISAYTAKLHGSFETAGEPAEYQFEWGRQAANLNHVTPLESADDAPGTTAVAATIEGLEDFTEYHYRISASNGFGTSYGPIRSFKSTPPTPPAISDSAAQGITDTGVLLSATVNPHYGEVLYGFEYGESAGYGNQTIAGNLLPADNSGHPVQMEIGGLIPGQTYHYRAVAINFGGISYGPDQTFSTLDVPTILSSGVSGLTSSSATLEALVQPSSSPTSVHFEYGTGTGYGSSTAGVSVGGGSSAVPAKAQLSGLSAGTTYHFRAVASNAFGTVNGPDRVFDTAPGATVTPPPTCGKGFVKRGGECVRKHRRKRCKRGFAKRHGKCVRKKHRKRHRHAARARRHGAK